MKILDYLWGSASWFLWHESGSWEYFPAQTWLIPGWNGSASEAIPRKWYLRTSWWSRVQLQAIQGDGDPVFSSSSSHKKTDGICLRGYCFKLLLFEPCSWWTLLVRLAFKLHHHSTHFAKLELKTYFQIIFFLDFGFFFLLLLIWQNLLLLLQPTTADTSRVNIARVSKVETMSHLMTSQVYKSKYKFISFWLIVYLMTIINV